MLQLRLQLAPFALAALFAVAAAHLSLEPGPFRNTHLTASAPQKDTCELAFELGGAKFNVSELSVDVGGWVATNNVDTDFYCLNLCRTVTSERNCICYACGGSQYPAEQVAKTSQGNQCQAYLGKLSGAEWSLKGTTPADGLVLEYRGGEADKETHKERVTQIEMYCSKDPWGGPEFIGQKDSTYLFRWNSSFACPLQ
eukprot:m.229384 g.229384  ORF g.229384 m.229384 type:complete len:198 (+) comp18840_c0_seq3:190-783(+)